MYEQTDQKISILANKIDDDFSPVLISTYILYPLLWRNRMAPGDYGDFGEKGLRGEMGAKGLDGLPGRKVTSFIQPPNLFLIWCSLQLTMQ